ncbi:MAG: hypothetical protein AAF582_07155 [Pseudomonadota bacterium]
MLRATAFALIMIGVVSGTSEASGLTATQTVELATRSVDATGQERLTYERAEDVAPGEQVRYRIAYVNDGANAAENVTLVMPVPAEMVLVEGSVETAGSTVRFSADGGARFDARADLMIDDAGTLRPARGDEITHIQWQFDDPIAPTQSGAISFDAVLK